MSVDEGRILESCQDLWQVVLGLNLAGLEDSEGIWQEPTLTSYVSVSGDWRGAILLECPESVVRHAAAMLFALDTDSVTQDDLQDALNELTRMVGKNVHGLLPQAGKVSAPRAVIDGTTPDALVAMRGLSELRMSCEGRLVRLSVLERVPATDAAPAPTAPAATV